WLEQVIIYLAAYGLQCGIEVRISGKDERGCLGLYAAHGAHHGKAIAWLADVQVRQQYIKSCVIDLFRSIKNAGGSCFLKAMMLQNYLQRFAYPRFVIDEQNPGRHLLLQAKLDVGKLLIVGRWGKR